MTKPKSRNEVLEITISVGTRRFSFTLEEAKQLQKILNNTFVVEPAVLTDLSAVKGGNYDGMVWTTLKTTPVSSLGVGVVTNE